MKKILTLLLLTNFFMAFGSFVELKFSNKKNEMLYRKLTTELKCLVCQNQSLAESDAELANQLKEEIYKKVEQGDSRQDILDYVTNRYGEFILLQPSFSRQNILLWLAPVIFFLIGLNLLRKKIK